MRPPTTRTGIGTSWPFAISVTARVGPSRPIPPSATIGTGSPLPTRAEQQRQPHMDAIFNTLQGAGVNRSDLYLAWDFTVASEQSLTGPMLHLRDDAFAKLGTERPRCGLRRDRRHRPHHGARGSPPLASAS